MSESPIVIQGLPKEIVFLDDVIKIGSEFIMKKDVMKMKRDYLEFLYGDKLTEFLLLGAQKQFMEKV